MTSERIPRQHPNWLSEGGEMGALIRAKDWSATPLGPPDEWPQSLRSAVSILLPSRAQICLFWGRDLITIYNDPYRPTLGIKHPWALGRPVREVWSEFWEGVLRPLFEGVLDTGKAFGANDHPFFLERLGFPEETYFDVSYDPVRDESGGVGGVFCIVSETTGRVIGERRLRLLRDLGAATAPACSVEEVFRLAAGVLGEFRHDIAFALCYAPQAGTEGACRMCAVNVPHGATWAPEQFDLSGPWPAADALDAGGIVLDAKHLASAGTLPGGAWDEPATRAVVIPVEIPRHGSRATLVLGTSPRLPLDESYRDFLRLVAASLASAIAAATELEAERQRAAALAQLDRAKTAFFSNVSHEFRTPLTLLLAPLEDALASGPALPVGVKPGLEMAHRNGLRLQKLVNALLDFSRIEAGRMTAQFEPVDLVRATADVASNFRSACEKAGLGFAVRCAPLPEPVWVDRDLWEKVVLNLLSNAFKFTFEGAIEVEIAGGDGAAILRVRDSGVGIAAEELPRLFERFHRIEGVRARTHEGSGIGLALVRDLVGLHGGRIDVASTPGEGTAFTVTIPYGSSHLPQEQLRRESRPGVNAQAARAYVDEALGWIRGAEAPAGFPPARSDDERILVVEDNADMREHIARLLREYWRVEVAADGEDALARLRSGRFELVVTDVMMPRLDGFGLLRAIRGDSALAETPVLMLSARAGEEARIEGLDAGADDYLVKPFSARELLAQVRSLVSIRRMRKAAAIERELLLSSERSARSEAQLQRQRLVSLFTQTPSPIVILRGPRHVIELANPAACRVWGREPKDVVGKPLLVALPEVRGQGLDDLLDGVLASGKSYRGKERPVKIDRHGDGTLETVYFNFVYSPMHGVDGTIEGVLVSAFEVTDEVLGRRQVDDLRGRAEGANRTKDAFLAMLGHELRNPLSPIVSAIKLMRLRGVKAPELDILERQSNHLTRLVDDLLDISRITRGSIELRRRVIDLRDVVRRAMDMAAPLLEGRRLAVDLRLPNEPLPVIGDADRLAQVVSNLLTNAAKYSDPAGLVAISCHRDSEHVVVEVEDQGAGIAPEMQAHIFELFVQQSQTLDRSAGGLGLGLAIVKNLVELHGGQVSVHSDGLGHGSRFTVELPVALAASLEAGTPAAPPFRSHLRGPLRILIVDDNNDAATTLGDSLRLIGHIVQVAHDGELALSAAQVFPADVALVDIGLPRMDGYELARRLRALPNPPKRLFAVTGYGLETDRQRAMEAGFQRHFIKPVHVMELDEALAVAGPVEKTPG